MAPYKDAFDGFTDGLDGCDRSAEKVAKACIQTAAGVGNSVAAAATAGVGSLAGYAGIASTVSSMGLGGATTAIAGAMGTNVAGAAVTLLGGLSLDGLIAAMTVPGSTNTDVFLTYVTQVLAPQLWKGAIVVMDNLKVHHAERVRVAIESVGALVKFLPPLSPDLSPIEFCWSKLKQFLRSCEARTLESLDQAMAQAVNYITEDDAFGWFNHCGLFT